jgi:RimJ/RimL family protein N-acetyltransferase
VRADETQPRAGAPQVRRIRPEDWQASRALRLEALADTPIAFLETLEQAQGLDDEVWQQRAARGSVGGDSCQMIGWDGDRPIGTCVSFVADGRAWLVAVYVTPSARGQGLLAELVERCIWWAREQGAAELVLEVHEDNDRARKAYSRLGFVETGRRRPYPHDPRADELELVRPL